MEEILRDLQKQVEDAEGMLSYERNKFQKILASRERGIAEQISEGISLELRAIRDLTEYLEEDDKRRFQRRLDRIDRFLDEFGA